MLRSEVWKHNMWKWLTIVIAATRSKLTPAYHDWHFWKKLWLILNFSIKKHFTALSLRSQKRTHPTCHTKSTQEEQFWTQLLGPTNWGEKWEKRRKTQSRDTHGFNCGQWPTVILVNDFRDFPASIQTMTVDKPRTTSSSPLQFCSPLQSCCLSGRLQLMQVI